VEGETWMSCSNTLRADSRKGLITSAFTVYVPLALGYWSHTKSPIFYKFIILYHVQEYIMNSSMNVYYNLSSSMWQMFIANFSETTRFFGYYSGNFLLTKPMQRDLGLFYCFIEKTKK